MVKTDRTYKGRTILEVGEQVFLSSEEDLLSLRNLAQAVPPEAAWDEDYPIQECWPWAVSGSDLGLILRHHPTGQRMRMDANDWASLQEALYVGDDLLGQAEAARLASLPQQRIYESIVSGRLFAFRRPGYQRRQWLIPRRALEEFIKRKKGERKDGED